MARKIHRAATASIKIQTSITDYHLVAPLIRYPLPDNKKVWSFTKVGAGGSARVVINITRVKIF